MLNPFRKKAGQEVELIELEKKVRNDLRQLSRIASDIILDTRYQLFGKLIKEAEENTLELLFRYKESDPYKYKAKIDEFLIELRVYKNLLNSVRDLAQETDSDSQDSVGIGKFIK